MAPNALPHDHFAPHPRTRVLCPSGHCMHNSYVRRVLLLAPLVLVACAPEPGPSAVAAAPLAPRVVVALGPAADHYGTATTPAPSGEPYARVFAALVARAKELGRPV